MKLLARLFSTLWHHVRKGGLTGWLGLFVGGVIVTLMTLLFLRLSENIATYESEGAGAKRIESLYYLINGMQRHRDLTAALRANTGERYEEIIVLNMEIEAAVSAVDTILPPQLQSAPRWQGAASDWRDIVQDGSEWTMYESYRRHTALIDALRLLLVDVADDSRLTLDQSLDTFYIQDLLVSKLPDVHESLSRLRALGVWTLTRQSLREELVRQLSKTLDMLTTAHQEHEEVLERMRRSLPEKAEALAQASAQQALQLAALIEVIEGDILAGRFAIPPQDYFALASVQIEASATLATEVYQTELNRRLTERIARARQQMWLVGMIVLLAVLSLAYIVRQVITHARTLASANSELATENVLRRKTEEELRIAGAQAVTANRAKSEFLANLSHEVRTPLNGILGMADVLAMSELDDEQKNLLTEMTASGKQLKVLLDRIIDFTHIEAGEISLATTPFALQELLDAVMRTHGAAAAAKGLKFSLAAPDDLPGIVVGDGRRLAQALDCLIDNALKFTESGEVVFGVEVSAALPLAANSANAPTQMTAPAAQPINLRLSVTDTGPGIPLAQRDFIFESFTQADGSITRRFGGNGLGLAIARRLTQLMGGELTLADRPGGGSVFTLSVTFQPYEDG